VVVVSFNNGELVVVIICASLRPCTRTALYRNLAPCRCRGEMSLYTAYKDSRGNPPNLAILSFQAPDDMDLVTMRLYLKEAGPIYTLLDQRQIYGVGGYVEGYFPFLTAVHGESYAVISCIRMPPRPIGSIAMPTTLRHRQRAGVDEHPMIGSSSARVFLTMRQQGERAICSAEKLEGQPVAVSMRSPRR